MNTDQAYILGLVIGGGKFSPDKKCLTIRMPYKQWGDIAKNPQRAGIIAKDIMKVVAPVMKAEYGIDVTYTISPSVWTIDCFNNVNQLANELTSYNVDIWGIPNHTCDISGVISAFVDDNMKRRFIAGIADTIGSMAPSQRRFSDDVQIISFEIRGFAFRFVCQLCNLLYSVGCIPDQILWQHPNLQAGENRYYESWKKGNKLRVTLDAFSSYGALAFRSKAESSVENRSLQTRTNIPELCEEKGVVISGQTCKHIDENYNGLPEEMRGCHFLHSKHICAFLQCPHAPYSKIDQLLFDADKYISPFTVLTKDTSANIGKIILSEPILKNRLYRMFSVKVTDIISAIYNGCTIMRFTDKPIFLYDTDYGYPLNVVKTAVAYVLASQTGELFGKRIKGSQDDLISRSIKNNPSISVNIKVPDKLTPIIITDGKASAMVGPRNSNTYKKLLSIDKDNHYKLCIRDIKEEDLN